MSYNEIYEQWLNADLTPDLHKELLAMDEKQRKMHSIHILSSVQLVNVVF